MKHSQLPLDPSRVAIAQAEAGIDSVAELARRSEMSRLHVSRVLNERVPATPYTVGRLAKALGVRVVDLLRVNGEEAEA